MKSADLGSKATAAILYVDDEYHSLKYFKRLFGRDYSILTALSVKDAEARLNLQAGGIGVIICDQRMPEGSGVQLLERVKNDYPHIVRLLTTAYADMQSAIDAVNRGEIHRYITKPWQLEHLRGEIHQAMQLHLERSYQNELLAARRRTMLALASHVAHELRTPLASIRTAAGNLKALWTDMLEVYEQQGASANYSKDAIASMRHTPGQIQEVVDRANLLINVLLMNAREDAGPDTSRETLSIVHCVKASLDTYPFRPGERDRITLQGEDFQLYGSELLLCFMFYNLIMNSLDAIHARGQGEIQLQLQPGDDFNQLRFTDTGVGIAAEVLPLIFDQFYSGKNDGQGTGMGLPFCLRVMKGLGGDIQCRSRPGEFTELLLRFPASSSTGDQGP